MRSTPLQRYAAAAKTQLRLMFPCSILPALVFCLLAAQLFSLRNLDAYRASLPLERLFSLYGILLFTPVFLPEQKWQIREAVASRTTSFWGTLALRFSLLVPLSVLPVAVLLLCMQASGSVFPFGLFLFGGVVSAFTLGSIGFAAFLCTGNWVVGYIAPVLWYAINFGSGTKLGNFYLFSLTQQNVIPKYVSLALSLLLVVAAFLFSVLRARRRGIY